MRRWSNAAIHTYKVDTPTGCGSGVAISDDMILTAWHVVSGEWPSNIRVSEPVYSGDYQVVSVVKLGTLDAALLHIVGTALNPVNVRESRPMFGEWVTMAGFVHCNPEVVVTEGAIAGRWFFQDTLVDGAVIPGMSGGPVLDVNGNLIGICTATTTGYGRALGVFLPYYQISKEM